MQTPQPFPEAPAVSEASVPTPAEAGPPPALAAGPGVWDDTLGYVPGLSPFPPAPPRP
jgi:hypothetical protein